ncbi:MAG: prenyltransferase [Chlorobi bacterium]|nr:prenyltransferase [Chlorobiota bacterium]
MNVKLWIQALRVIPRLTKEDWKGLDLISRWLVVTRSAVFIMTFLSSAIGGILAWRDGQVDWLLWLLTTIGLIMAHASNNILNDITDYFKGVDKNNYFRAQYGPHPLEHGFLSLKQLIAYFIVTLLIGVLIGIYLIHVRGEGVLWLFLAGLFFLLFYTYPLKYFGLGELAVLLVWGPLMIGGTYYVITGQWKWEVVIASFPYALGVTSVLFGKHIDKIDADRAKGVRTFPVLVGEKAARWIAILLISMQYVTVVYLVIIGFFTPIMLIVFLAIKDFIKTIKVFLNPKPETKPEDYPESAWPLWFVAHAFVHNRKFGILFMLGLLLETLYIRFVV